MSHTQFFRRGGLLALCLAVLAILAPVAKGETVNEIKALFYYDEKPVVIKIVDGKITGLERLDAPASGDMLFVAPGLIDNQVNGYMGCRFVGESLDIEGIRKATQELWKAGVTTYFPTLTSITHELLKKNFAILAKASKEPDIGPSIPGFHLEGPYISPVPGYRGAHNEQFIRKPDWKEMQELIEAADNKILQVTVAPEIEGMMDFIAKLNAAGIVVAIGHQNGSPDQIKRSIDNGVRIATHLGNGIPPEINRWHNTLWPQLSDDRLMASVICDGFHNTPDQVNVFFKVKGPELFVLTSDVNELAGMPPGEYERYGRKVILAPEGVIRMPGEGVLAGAASAINLGVENLMRFTGCSLRDAIDVGSRNPARLYGLTDRGEIAPGKRADLILFTLKDGKFTIKKTIVGGEVVYSE